MQSVLGPPVSRRRSTFWFLGFGLWWAVWFAARLTPPAWLIPPERGVALVQNDLLLGSGSVSYALTFLLLIGLRKQLYPLHERVPLLIGAATVSGVGLALVCLNGMAFLGPVGAVVGLSFSQVAAALLVLAWVELYGALGARQACIGICGSLLIGAGLYLFVATVGPVVPLATAVVLAALPALSLGALAMAWGDPSLRPLDAAVQQQPFRMPAALAGGMFAYGFAIGFMVILTTSHSKAGPGAVLAPIVCIGAIALLVLVHTLSTRALSLRFACWSILVLLAVGFMLLPVVGYVYANLVATAGYACLAIFWITACSDIVDRVPAPALAVAGWSAFANYGGAVVGGAVSAVLLGGITLSVWQLSVVSGTMVSLLMLASLLLLGDTALTTLWGLMRSPAEPAPEMPEGLVEGRCAAMAVAHGLTPREQEILVLLAQGRTTDDIGRALVISSATVRTHAKRLHEKLHVHSQPQLIRLVVFDPQTDHLQRAECDPVQS